MGSELGFTARQVDLDGFLTELRAEEKTRSDLKVAVREFRHEGRADCLWGAKLSGMPDEIWVEAQEEADRGEGTIETIEPADGSTPFDAIVFEGPYRERVLASLRLNGDPTFAYATTFTLVDCAVGQTALRLGFDQTTLASGDPHPKDGQALLIWSSGEWQGRDREVTAADHVAVVGLLDILARHCELEVSDSTQYYHHRIEMALVASMAADREMRADLRAALIAIKSGLSPTDNLEPPLTIAQLLGEAEQPAS